MRLFTTLHNYKKNYLAKDLIAGVVMAAVSISDRHGICGSIGPSGRLWAVWFGTSDSFICLLFDIATVYLWRGMPHRQQLLAPV